MVWVFVWFICGFICSVIAVNKGRSIVGFFLIGLLLGPLGILLAAFLSKNDIKLEKKFIKSGMMCKCPFCAELIKTEAVKCRHCQSEIPEEKKAEIVKMRVDEMDNSKLIVQCNCGGSFAYKMTEIGKNGRCPGCGSLIMLKEYS